MFYTLVGSRDKKKGRRRITMEREREREREGGREGAGQVRLRFKMLTTAS